MSVPASTTAAAPALASASRAARAHLAGELEALRQRLESSAPAEEGLAAIRSEIGALRAEAHLWAHHELGGALQRLSLVTEVWECVAADDPAVALEVGSFCQEALGRLAAATEADALAEPAAWLLHESSARWGAYLGLLGQDGDGQVAEPDPCAGESSPAALELDLDLDADGQFAPGTSPLDVDSLLRMLTQEQHDHPGRAHEDPPGPARTPSGAYEPASGQDLSPQAAEANTHSDGEHSPHDRAASGSVTDDAVVPAAEAVAVADPCMPASSTSRVSSDSSLAGLEPELREAFLADAADLFERIQTLLLEDLNRPDAAPMALRELGRCFHTLKGAAGSVGLSALVEQVHDLEDRLEEASTGAAEVPTDRLYQALNMLESVVDQLRQEDHPNPVAAVIGPRLWQGDEHEEPAHEPAPDTEPGEDVGTEPAEAIGSQDKSTAGAGASGSIRVPCERIEELMDLVAELISRRGLWAAQAETMKSFTATARAGRNRLMASIDRMRDLASSGGLNGQAEGAEPGSVDASGLILRLAEQAEDLAALAETSRAAADPLADDADALARLSVRLWDALQSVRVVPVRGLFHRLARVAREAARVEGRPIEVLLRGEDNGLDRAVQEKAFEPLLHVVRNAVGHGIEPLQDRLRAGKPPLGRVTLEAHREGYSLIIKVQDDGRGLDYPAIAEKGRRLGFLKVDEEPTPDRLDALVFRSGFTTKEQADEISGRGVGMDVVAQTVSRLHGTVALASQPGLGTTLTIKLPARLALEQAMVVRIAGRPFALPLAAIELAQQFLPADLDAPGAAATVQVRERRVPLRDARRALGLAAATPLLRPKLLVVRADGQSLALLVDAIDGPCELVIKPLGPLLAGHPAIAGTSLSPTGELILVLDPYGLVRHRPEVAALPPGESLPARSTKVLVVDDAISVRRAARRHLRTLGLETDEAIDGVEALRKMRSGAYRLVLIDLEIPRMDGFELLAELARSGAAAATPIVIISSRSDAHTLRRVLDLGAKALLPKPIGPDDLTETIVPLLQSGGAPVALALTPVSQAVS